VPALVKMVNSMTTLSESASNVFENLACRLASRNGGRIHPHGILPFLPISLKMVPECLHDEVQLKVVRIPVTLGVMFLGMLVLAVFHVPFPLLARLILLSGPIVAILIWRHEGKVPEE